ncbi:MAG: hypothetical protein IT233_12165 [Bacteroidia bacterium]|nr:hypothetical protein [Bacteroidia bacterium]
MKASPELHELIHSLNRPERRFFTIFSGRHGERTADYLRLFNKIAAQEVYREDALCGDQKHYAAAKNYLHESVLDSLAVFHREDTYLARHSALLVQIEQLYKRGLFRQCMKRIQKAKKSAYLQELYPFLLMFLRWETIIHIKNEDEAKLEENMKEELRMNEILRLQYVLMQLAFRVQIRIEKGNLDAAGIAEYKQQLRRHEPIPAELGSFWTSYYFHSTLGLLATAEGDHQARYDSYIAVKDVMEAAPVFIRDLPGIYHLNMNNLLNVTFRLGMYDQAGKMLSEQRNFMDKYGVRNITLGRIMFLNTSENELFLHYKTGQAQQGMYFLRSIEKTLAATPVSFSPLVFDVLFMMASVALSGGDLRSASRFLNRIFNEEKIGKIRPELSITSRLLYLVILYESGDVLFESRYHGLRRLLRKYPQFSFYTHFSELLNLAYERRENESAFREKWHVLQAERSRFTGDEANKQFDFAGWIASRLSLS